MSALPSAVDASSGAFMRAAERTNTLFELSDTYLEVLELLERTEEPESTDDDDAELLRQLDAIAGQIRDKAEAIAGLIKHLEYRAAARKAEAKRLLARSSTDARHAERLREYLFQNMRAIDIRRIETVRFTVAMRKNPPSVEIVNLDELPAEFLRTRTETLPDKLGIQEHFRETGEVVPGTAIVRSERLDIS